MVAGNYLSQYDVDIFLCPILALSIHPPLETKVPYKTLSYRFCACSGGLNITTYFVQKTRDCTLTG